MRDRPMSILAHFKELRRRLWWVAIVFLVGFALGIAFYHPLIKELLIPAHGLLSPNSTPIVTSPTEFMGVTIKLAFLSGLLFALPMAVYEIVMFVAPAISSSTKRFLFLLFPATFILFAGGFSMGYFLVLPMMFKFLIHFGSDLVTPMIRLSDYMNLVIMLLAGIGFAYETPMIMFVLAKLRIVSHKGFLHFWKYIVVISFIIGGFFDPTPNPFDQIVVAGTIIVLYGVGILLAWLVRRRETLSPKPAVI